MPSGLDQPAKLTESKSPASIPFEPAYLEAPRGQTTGRVEPPTLDFTVPLNTQASPQKPIEVSQATRSELGRSRLSIDTADDRRWIRSQEPPAKVPETQRVTAPERQTERFSAPNEQSNRSPVWDPSRPGWDQPQLRRRETHVPQDTVKPQQQPGDQRNAPSDRQQAPERPIVRSAQTFNLSDRLDARTMGRIPDAKVFVNPNFDPSKPVNVIVYNHGWNDTIGSAFRNARLQEQMAQAPPNSILIVPSWQKVDGAANGVSNSKFKTGFIGAIDASMRLNGKTLGDVSNITIVSHSAGYNAVAHELNQLRTSPLYEKVTTLASFDSQYETKQAVDDWIEHNVKNGKFASGKAAFLNLWTSETASLSGVQAESTTALVRRNPNLISIDYGRRGRGPLGPQELAGTPIVFANTKDDHANVPIRYFGHAISKLQRLNR